MGKNKIDNIISSKEKSEVLPDPAESRGLMGPPPGGSCKALFNVNICRFVAFGAFIGLLLNAPKGVHPAGVDPAEALRSEKTAQQHTVVASSRTASSRLVLKQSNPDSVVSRKRNRDQQKSAKSARKAPVSPFSAEALLADHPAPLSKPKSELATTLSGRKKPESVELFIRLLRQSRRMDRFQGKVFVAEGEAYYSQGVPEGFFLLFRWYIDCCTAEVKPVGILVRGSMPESPNNTNWVMVDGILEFQTFDGFRLPYIAAGQVNEMTVPPPEKQYISY